MRPRKDISDEAKNLTIGRKDFDHALSKLIATPPASKKTISAKINRWGRNRSLTRSILSKDSLA